MNVVIGLITAILPFLKELIVPDKDPVQKRIRGLRRQLRRLKRHFKSKDSPGGRKITIEEEEVLMHIENKITELLTTKTK